MENLILINVTFSETRVALSENGAISEIYIERKSHPRIVGNIYKGRVGKIVPGMQAAFVDIGLDKSGFISVEDVTEEPFWAFLGGEEGEEEYHKPKAQPSLIQDMLREGQEVLVQVIKEPSGGKGPKLSSNVAIPGKYLVLLGTADIVGISRRIVSKEERSRLSALVNKAKPPGIGFIVRTASEDAPEGEILSELRYLTGTWDEIKRRSDGKSAPVLLYEEPSLYIRAIRDLATGDLKKIIVDSKEVYREIIAYLKSRYIGTDVAVELHEDPTPLFTRYGVEEEINRIYEKKVWLKSGGYLIIDLAEALTVIDVNTGRYLKGTTQDETIYNINVEAAIEIARQIRLRNLVGIIVIDFIDMKDQNKRKEVFRVFTEALERDKARSVILEMSPFGVVQMTRQRVRENLLSMISEPCEVCGGTGYVKSLESTVYEMLRLIKYNVQRGPITKITVKGDEKLISLLETIEGENLKRFVAELGVGLHIIPLKGEKHGYYELIAT